jgi:bacteriocin-like protein
LIPFRPERDPFENGDSSDPLLRLQVSLPSERERSKTMSEDPKKPSEDEKKTSDELSNKDLEQVTGGAIDTFLNIGGAPGESTTSVHTGLPLRPSTYSVIPHK